MQIKAPMHRREKSGQKNMDIIMIFNPAALPFLPCLPMCSGLWMFPSRKAQLQKEKYGLQNTAIGMILPRPQILYPNQLQPIFHNPKGQYLKEKSGLLNMVIGMISIR